MNQNDTITSFNEIYQTNKKYLRAGGSGFAYGFHHQPCTPESPMQCWYTIIIIERDNIKLIVTRIPGRENYR